MKHLHRFREVRIKRLRELGIADISDRVFDIMEVLSKATKARLREQCADVRLVRFANRQSNNNACPDIGGEEMPKRNARTSSRIACLLILGVIATVSSRACAQDRFPNSITVLEFGDANTLFVADSDNSRVFAFQLPNATKADQSISYNVNGFGQKAAGVLGVDSRAITFHDIAIHPESKEAFVSASVAKGEKRLPVLFKANQEGHVTQVDLTKVASTHQDLSKTATDRVKFWRDIPASTFTVTDLDFADGTLYVSGLSTGEFASTLRRIPFPFRDAVQTSHIEIYHTVHDQTETRAPIRAMTVMDLSGEQTVVAAYTCTPLVTLPTKALTDGAHVKGKTVAELGYGNTPLDVIDFVAQNQEGKSEGFVLVVNKERSADLIRVDDLVAANRKEGLSKPEMWAHAGVPSRPLPLGGVMQVADQDGQFLAMLKRNLTTGDVDLVSYRKGAYFRLNDFVSEYNFPDYQYEARQDYFRNFQNLLKADAGYPDLARERAEGE